MEIELLRQRLAEGGGGSGSPSTGIHNEELERRLAEMKQLQEQSWEEKRRLTEQLELERKNNVNAAISSVLNGVQAQKREIMKNIKRLQQEKHTLTAEQKQEKEQITQIKQRLDGLLDRYRKLQDDHSAFEAKGDLTPEATASANQVLLCWKSDNNNNNNSNTLTSMSRDVVVAGQNAVNRCWMQLNETAKTCFADGSDTMGCVRG